MACEALVCRACLATDVKLCSLAEESLQHSYRLLTGEQPHRLDGLPQRLCYECAARVRGSGEFSARCLRARDALRQLLREHRQITEGCVRAVDRRAAALVSPLCVDGVSVDSAGGDSACDVKSERGEDDACVVVKQEWEYEDTTGSPSLKTDLANPAVVKDGDRNDYDEYNDNNEENNDFYEPNIDFEINNKVENGANVCDEEDPNEDLSDDDPLSKHLVMRSKVDSEKVSKKKSISDRHKTKKRNLQRNIEDVRNIVKKSRGRKQFDEDFATVITLSHSEQLEEVRKRQTSLNYTNSPYKCDKCFKGFVDEAAFSNHTLRHQPISGNHVCPVCEVRCQTPRKLKSHTIAAHARKYACRACAHISSTSNQAREHEKWHRGFLYECKLCGETFRKSTTYLTHVRVRHPTEFVCDACGDAFVGRHGLAVHKKRTHGNRQDKNEVGCETVYCGQCDVNFASEEAWRRHTVTSVHHGTDVRTGFACRTCGATLPTQQEQAVHGATHAGRRRDEPAGGVKCEQCDATFSSSRTCLAHYKRMHLGIKYAVKKNIVCEVCGKKCTSNATLAYHQRTHTGEKPFQCSECPKRFGIRQRLQIHERTHTGERPYPCSHCHKAFRHKPALNRHLRVHTGAKPYECQYCGKTFSQSNSMKLHVHTVHLKLPPPYRNRGGHKVALSAVPLPARPT